MSVSFEFKQCIAMHKPGGKKAKNLRELRNALETVSKRSVFYHTSTS
jgi:hypothetical protein